MQEKDKTRRKVLIGLTSAVGLSGIPFAATPFIAAWNPSAKANAAGAPVKLDVSKMQFNRTIILMLIIQFNNKNNKFNNINIPLYNSIITAVPGKNATHYYMLMKVFCIFYFNDMCIWIWIIEI